MIFYKDKKIKKQIESDYKELENYKNSYSKRISLYNTYLDTMQLFEDGIVEKNHLDKEEIENKKQVFQIEINKIDSHLERLASLLKNMEATGNGGIEKTTLYQYNQTYKEIRNHYIRNSVLEEQITEKYINGLMADVAKTIERMKEKHVKEMEKVLTEKANGQDVTEKKETGIQGEPIVNDIENKKMHIKNNDTLLISEKQGKVILPYKAEEVVRIFNQEKSKYSSVEEVIEDTFTRNFSDFKIQFASRYAETMKLARDRENYSFIDAIAIATEMMNKRFLHPAIISACRTLNELDVYLDCLDKNELEDFKIFKVKYELYPMVIKQNGGKRGKRYANDSNSNMWTNIKNMVKKDKTIKNEIL